MQVLQSLYMSCKCKKLQRVKWTPACNGLPSGAMQSQSYNAFINKHFKDCTAVFVLLGKVDKVLKD